MIERSREFVELAVRLNYAAAADALHLSISALSRHIASLENELGFALFSRNPLALTPAGHYYLEAISSLIGDFDRIVRKGRAISARSTGSLCIYMLPVRTRFADIIYEAVAQMRRDMPELDVRICVDDHALTTDEALLRGKADIGIVFADSIVANPAIEVVPLARSALCAWVHRDNPLSTCQTVSLQDLAAYAHPKSTNRQSHTAAVSIERLFRSNGLDLKFHLRDIEKRSDFYLTLKEDEFLIEFEEEADLCRFNPNLVQLSFEKPLMRPVFIAFLKNRVNPLVDQFITLSQALSEKQGLNIPL